MTVQTDVREGDRLYFRAQSVFELSVIETLPGIEGQIQAQFGFTPNFTVAKELLEEALAARFVGRHAEALSLLEQTRSRNPSMRGLEYQFALTHLDLGDYEAADERAACGPRVPEDRRSPAPLRPPPGSRPGRSWPGPGPGPRRGCAPSSTPRR